jgi:hypothetical protein
MTWSLQLYINNFATKTARLLAYQSHTGILGILPYTGDVAQRQL